MNDDKSDLQQVVRQAMQLHQSGRLEQAKSLYNQVLSAMPRHPDALHLYGLACHQQGDHKTAVEYIQKAVDMVPDQAVLRNNLGEALRKAGEPVKALKHLRYAVKLRPEYAGAHQNLGITCLKTGERDAALLHAREACRLDEGRAEAWFNLGMVCQDQMLLEESVDAFRKALNIRPEYPVAATRLLYLLNLLPGADPSAVAQEHQKVATGLYGSVQKTSGVQQLERRIRVGYVSGDFSAHAVSYYYEPILQHHTVEQFETYCYSDVSKPDFVTDRLQRLAGHWRDIVALTDDEVCQQIKNDRIDILVDLAGYTYHCRLGVFAARPARCQITYLGYPNTTGLEAMDYRVVDQYTVPVNQPETGSENLIRLPRSFMCFRPPERTPAVQASPAKTNGFVTFGSLHKLEKLNHKLIEAWASILRKNPTSHLVLVRDQLDDWHQARLQDLFQRQGIDSDRIEMIQYSSGGASFFDYFSKMDVLLDTFPWSGHTLACCALWMGVPVVTLEGNCHAGRMVASVLDELELNEWIAQDVESYVRIAGELCNSPQSLDRIRTELRARIERSSLRDEAGFTKIFESACLDALVGKPSG